MRRLRLEDFWDGLKRPLKADTIIEVSVEFRDFERNENLLAVLADHLVKPDPMVARITYRFQPVAGLTTPPNGEGDYEFVVFGGDRPDNLVGYELRRWMPMDLFPALRDAESDLARWSCSPLRPLLDRAAQAIDAKALAGIAADVHSAIDSIGKGRFAQRLASVMLDKNVKACPKYISDAFVQATATVLVVRSSMFLAVRLDVRNTAIFAAG